MTQRVNTYHSYREAKLEAAILSDEGAKDIHIRQRTKSYAGKILWDVYYTPRKKLNLFGA